MEKKNIPLSVPNLDLDILPYIQETIETGWVSTGGRFITEFEEKVREFINADYTRGVQSGTAGLHLSLLVLGLKPGEEVIVPTLTFIAAVNPVHYSHAYPVFMDCADDLNIDPIKLRSFLAEECTFENGIVVNKNSGRRIKGIVVVHVFGNPADMESIMQIAAEYNLFVLEDASEALGSKYTEGKYAGKYCGTIGDLGVLSFNANKILTTGGGGMVIAPAKELADEISFLAAQAKTDPLRFIHDEVGYNYRMTNIAAAFGVSQIDKLEQFLETKRNNYFRYKAAFNDHGLTILDFNAGTDPNYWFYSLLIDETKFGMNKETLMTKLIDHGIQTRPIWGLIHQQRPYLNHQAYQIDKALYYADRVLNIPCSTNLTTDDLDFVVETIISLKKT
ncbi:MAG TPA: LegC family aminotransferase [Clostridiaceae bacterium]|nr:LegC family aminotransferase [Clostridiaceae bacterium]